jgi:hypothetical protein
MYHVVTANAFGGYHTMFSGTRDACRRYIVGHWGHWPPFAHITVNPAKWAHRMGI